MMTKLSKTHRGAGLIEVMVSLLILGVGLLGVLSLQANGLGSNQRALFVTEAQILAQDMADRIIAFGGSGVDVAGFGGTGNSGANLGDYGNTRTAPSTATAAYAAPACLANIATTGCDLANTIIYDRSEWEQAIRDNDRSLPAAYGEVDWVAGATGGVYTIRIRWDQDRTGAAGRVCNSNDKEANLTCFEMEVRLQ